jgi:mannosyltransferase
MSQGLSFSDGGPRIVRRFLKDNSSIVWLGIILILAVSLRIYNLGTESYWVDEIFSLIDGRQPLYQLFGSGRADEPPAYYLPFHFWMQIFGTSEAATRSFSVIAGICSIVLLYLIGRELFGNEVGLLGAFFMTISLNQIYYSQEARFYGYYQFTTLLSFLFFIIALRSKKNLFFFLFGAASISMLFSLTYGVFILAAQNLFIILHIKKYRSVINIWFICQTLILLVFGSYLYSIFFGGSDLTNSVVSQMGTGDFDLSVLDPVRTIYRFIIPARLDRSWGGVLATYALAVGFLIICTWLYAIRLGMRTWIAAATNLFSEFQKIPGFAEKLILACSWLLIPIILPFIFSYTISPIYRERYMIGAAPALFLLLALGAFSIRKVIPLAISLTALVIVVTPGIRHYYAEDLKEQWREVAAYVEKSSRGDEVIVFAPSTIKDIEQKTFNWYYQGALPECTIDYTLNDVSERREALEHCTKGYTNFWVVIRDTSESEDPSKTFRSFFLNADQTAARLINSRQFVKVSVYLFELIK